MYRDAADRVELLNCELAGNNAVTAADYAHGIGQGSRRYGDLLHLFSLPPHFGHAPGPGALS
jgi:hypothetical protein